MFVTRLSEHEDQQCRGKSAPAEQDQKDGYKHWWKSQKELSMVRGADVLLILSICPCTLQRKSSETSTSDGLGRVRSKSTGTD